ncbi:hypothetical protein SAY86_027052 [Trapa natans]|uniref:AAA+ ATPase domain-containing protein n=1 Tax=Trapa natans TaxID=22666 RepID=A0AAN7QIG1_TRANT|nr:hypothetical protein SAY86_027052 [Trapa natans]
MSDHHHPFRGSPSASPVPDHGTPDDPSITTATAVQVVPYGASVDPPSSIVVAPIPHGSGAAAPTYRSFDIDPTNPSSATAKQVPQGAITGPSFTTAAAVPHGTSSYLPLTEGAPVPPGIPSYLPFPVGAQVPDGTQSYLPFSAVAPVSHTNQTELSFATSAAVSHGSPTDLSSSISPNLHGALTHPSFTVSVQVPAAYPSPTLVAPLFTYGASNYSHIVNQLPYGLPTATVVHNRQGSASIDPPAKRRKQIDSSSTTEATPVISDGDLFDPSSATSFHIHGVLTSTTLSTTAPASGCAPTDPSSSRCAEGEVVEKILKDVMKYLDRNKLDVPDDYLVGIDDQVDEVRDMLAIEIADVRIVGICGMGGIGKTTIAKLIYNQLREHFERCSFLEDVRERSLEPSGMETLQRQLASDIWLRGQSQFDNTGKGKSKLKSRIPHEKVLILLDDADRPEHLRNLLPSLHDYVAGSRIIVTTRDRAVLEAFQIQHIHEVTGLKQEDALVLFCKYAFHQDSPAVELAHLSREIVEATGGLPLAIEVIGSHLSSTREADVWDEALQLLKNEKRVHQRLRISYDSLSHNAKEIFLDISCLFSGMDYRIPSHMWKPCELSPANARRELCQRCLIKIGNDKKIWMHDLLKDLGREIVRQENEHPGERTRLWRHSDAFDVLEMKLGTNKVEAIHLDIGVEDISDGGFDGKKFRK